LDKRFKETAEQFKETDEKFKQLAAQSKRTDKKIKEINKQLGNLSNRFGEVEEHLVATRIADKFNELGYHFDEAGRNVKIFSDKNVLAEIDILLENDDFILCIEVKVTPRDEDIANHIEQLKTAYDYFKTRRPKEKKVIGAIAGTVFSDKLKKAILENGMYTISPTGNTFKIDVPEGFQPAFLNQIIKERYTKIVIIRRDFCNNPVRQITLNCSHLNFLLKLPACMAESRQAVY
jgi:hypothetical protein